MLINGEKFQLLPTQQKFSKKQDLDIEIELLEKADGYLRIRKERSILQNPYPMYFYPDIY
jgi:site-specific DNA-methyltransferase (adenine-specific)